MLLCFFVCFPIGAIVRRSARVGRLWRLVIIYCRGACPGPCSARAAVLISSGMGHGGVFGGNRGSPLLAVRLPPQPFKVSRATPSFPAVALSTTIETSIPPRDRRRTNSTPLWGTANLRRKKTKKRRNFFCPLAACFPFAAGSLSFAPRRPRAPAERAWSGVRANAPRLEGKGARAGAPSRHHHHRRRKGGPPSRSPALPPPSPAEKDEGTRRAVRAAARGADR